MKYGMWETSAVVTPEMAEEARQILTELMNAIPDEINLVRAAVLLKGVEWEFSTKSALVFKPRGQDLKFDPRL